MAQEVTNGHKLPGSFGRKVLNSVPTLAFGRAKDCTFAGGLEAALNVTNYPHSYSDLMGYSALSFRVRWHEAWCPSCTVGEMDEEIAALAKATGWRLRVEVGKQGLDMERFTADIVASIDAGRPVLVYSPDLNIAVAYGYDDAGKTLFVRDYLKGDQVTTVAIRDLGFLLIFLGEHVAPALPGEAVATALRAAVTNWRRGTARDGHAPADYFYGQAALERWIADLARADALAEDQREKLFFLHWLNFATIADARPTAVTFLKDHANLFPESARPELERAIEVYEKETAMLAGFFASKDAFLGPWTGKVFEDWTPEVRERERAALTALTNLESTAITHLDTVVNALHTA